MADYDQQRLNEELTRLRRNGLVMPRHSGRAAQSYGEAVTQTRAIQKAAGVGLDNLAVSVGRPIVGGEDLQSPEVQRMLKENQAKMSAMDQKRNLSHRGMRRTGASVVPSGTDAQNAIPRFYDPLEYWDLSGLPWNVADEGHRHKLHKWLRLYYATHYLVPTLIDIFTRFPLIGMEFECFDGDTRILTKEGTRRIESLSGREPEVLNGYGRWQKVPVECRGLREIWEVTVRRNKREKVIRTTKNHRWLLESNRSATTRARSGPGPRPVALTKELQTGDRLASCFPINQIKKGSDTHPSSFGVAHGFSLPGFFKDVPSIDEGTSYPYGWLAGYFAADGTVSKKGAAYLDSANRSNLEYFRDVCTRLGIKTASIYSYSVAKKRLPSGRIIENWKGYRLPIAIQSLTAEFFIIDGHRARYEHHIATAPMRNEEWAVVSVRATGEEEMVYCATVEGSESFVLEDNILTGNCKDHALTDIYEEIFMRNLNYDEFFVSLGREYWCVGEAFPLGSFDEDLGVWEHEELINPEDVVIDNFPFLNTQQLKIVPPDYLRRIAQTKSPAREWYQLQEQFADLIPYLLKGEHIPISPVMIRQVANKMNNWDDHGTPILLRGLRTLLYEEKLLASQEAIAERLYSPLILAKLGIMDMGDGLPPWIPTPAELTSVRDDLDIALASDFRLMVHHFGLDITSVFGREQMPRLGDDFDRIERRIMQVFGVNPSLLSAGSNSQPYASSALQAEFMNQILKTFQNMLKAHYRERALVVAEAQGHQDYEKKGQTRVPIFEKVVVYDEEGEKHIKEVPKLLVPDLTFACLAYGSRVSTPEGPVATETLEEGDWVIGWDLLIDCAIPAEVTHSYDNGIQDVYQITTKLGRQIEATSEHPFLTNKGWIEAHDLYPGIELRVGTDVPSGLSCPLITERDARFLGMIAGDGSVSCCEEGAVPAIANVDSEILRWVNNYALGFGCSLTPHGGGCIHYISQIDQRVNPNPIKKFLQDHEMSGKTSWTKRVPQSVWAAGPGAWAAFLSGYLDTDGSVVSDIRVVWDSRNRALLQDCHELLAFLGVRATLYEIDQSKWPDPQGVCHEGLSYRLVVQSKEALASCQRWLEPLAYRKQRMSTRVSAVDERRSLSPQQAQEIKVLVASKTNRLAAPTYREIGDRYDVSPSTVLRAAQGEYDELISTWISPKWDEVSSIKVIYDVPTWSLGIDGNHTHITEGLVTHNTFDLRDEATERQFLMELRQMGVPLPNADLLIGVDWKYKDKIDEYNTELKEQTIAQQQAKMETYYALTVKGLPVPLDLKAECESVLIHGPGSGGGAPQGQQGGGAPGGPPGGPPPPGGPGEPPGPGAQVMPPPPPGLGPGPGTAPPGGGPPPTAPNQGGPPGNVPPASNERRPGLTYNTSNEGKVMGLSVREGSELDAFLAEHELGVPFVDYLVDHYRGKEVEKISKKALGDLYKKWPKHASAYQQRVTDEVAARLAALAQETEAAATLAEPEEEFVLKSNQKLASRDGKEVIIETPKRRTRVKVEVPEDKRYAMFDSLHSEDYKSVELDKPKEQDVEPADPEST